MSNSFRRRIREATVQFLYAANSDFAAPAETDEGILNLLLEPFREKSLRLRVKAVLHLQQGRAAATSNLTELWQEMQGISKADKDGELQEAVSALYQAEENVRAALESLRREMNGTRVASRLSQHLDAAATASTESRRAYSRIKSASPVFTALLTIQENVFSLWEKLSKFVDRMEAAHQATPDASQRPELRSVAQAEEEIASISARVHTYLKGVRDHLSEIDSQLAHAIDNYVAERVDRVDRAILRLAAYELLFDADVPPAVAIDEAIELARAFGTSDSPRFVNGVLDRIMKERAS